MVQINQTSVIFVVYWLCVKATTSNVIVFGECGKLPPSMYWHAHVLCYLHRLKKAATSEDLKSVFNTLYDLKIQVSRTWAPYYLHVLTLIPAWISNHTPSKVWDEITYPFLNFNGCTVEVQEWISNFTVQGVQVQMVHVKELYCAYIWKHNNFMMNLDW